MTAMVAAINPGSWCHACALNAALQRAGGWAWGWSWWFWLWIIILLVIVFGGTWGYRHRTAGWTPGTTSASAEAVLKERYARGEIDLETYRRMLQELRQ